MKGFVLLLTILFASRFADVESRMTAQQIATTRKSVQKTCLTKSGVAKDVVEGRVDHVWPLDDRTLGCYYLCNMKMMKALGKDGKFNLENTLRLTETLLPEEFVEETIIMANSCAKQITSDDACLGASEYARCNWETHPDVFFFG